MVDVERIAELIENKRDLLIGVSDRLWGFAETRFEEFQSAALLCETLEQEGFTVTKGLAGMETAFVGSCGSGGPIVAILGEYDALSGLSQVKGASVQEPVQAGGNGHGCGHNLLGTGSLAAAIALKQYMEENGIPGTVRYYGCPGEEGGSGKTFMAREGIFDDVDFALCWHPGDLNIVLSVSMLANFQVYFKFKGRTSHAAASPHLGRSALDAVELMNVGVNYLREHMIPEARVHYAVTNSGGHSPNVVQGEAESLYLIRAPKISQVSELYERVCNIARGAALMTGTEVSIVFDKACSNLIPNRTLETVMHECFTELGIPAHDKEELALAARIRETLTPEERNGSNLVRFAPAQKDKAISDVLLPYREIPGSMPGSSDVGDVSWIAPTAQCMTACFAVGSPAHSWQWVTLGAHSIGHKGMLHAGKVMAATAAKAMQNPQLIEQAKAELKERLGGAPYVNPIPEGVKPSAVK
ncbi:M20 family metallopeptidase [Paenibacillus filicis]|uniref:M20 family metallopeptidase n=2 Tax=Paenibacillus gyeongsangnamensis TaxID=3388067 RepID=A0ABT4Q6R1_9BACL|nr:M20 family metallopeptidase [Paenibacillus filicis]MCZ8512521.1 M20 family metallopeptidase [Paenibacillus filicis]